LIPIFEDSFSFLSSRLCKANSPRKKQKMLRAFFENILSTCSYYLKFDTLLSN